MLTRRTIKLPNTPAAIPETQLSENWKLEVEQLRRQVNALRQAHYESSQVIDAFLKALNTKGVLTVTHATELEADGNIGAGIIAVPHNANARVVHVDGAANSAEVRLTNTATGSASGNGTILTLVGSDGFLYNLENGYLEFGTNNAARMRITADGRIYGTALHNNAGAVTGTTEQYIASGTYTPTPVGVANVAAVAGRLSQWIRVGNVVTVSGAASIDPTAAGVLTVFAIPLPVASNFTAASNLAGSAGEGFVPSATFYVAADTANDRAEFTYNASSAGALEVEFQFTYLIL